MDFVYNKAANTDGELLANIRVTKMRPSLEVVGRFDPERAGNRFLERFDPESTYKIQTDSTVIGFFVLKQRAD